MIDRLRGGAVRRGLQDGPVGPWVHEYRTALRIGLVLLAALVAIFLDRPSSGEILAIAVTLVVLLGVVEFLNQPRSPGERPLIAVDDRDPAATGEV